MLTLPIKKKWYDMILSGEKKEEYREIKDFYTSRLGDWLDITPKEIRFRNGYSRKSPSFIAKCRLKIGYGKPEWGAEPGKLCYILEIREIRKEDPDGLEKL